MMLLMNIMRYASVSARLRDAGVIIIDMRRHMRCARAPLRHWRVTVTYATAIYYAIY